MSSATTVNNGKTTRPGVALVANSQTPYRLAFHVRIAREMPEIKLHSIYTHDTSNAPWAFDTPAEINAQRFGVGESSEKQDSAANARREWIKAGKIIDYLTEHAVKAVVVLGYNDVGRLRIIRWCRSKGVAVFVFGDSNLRGDAARGLKGFIKRLYVGKVVAWCDGVMPCGTLGAKFFAKYGATPDRTFFMPYEPDYAMLAGISKAEIDAAAETYKLNRQRRRVVYCGRLVEVKCVDLLVKAFVAIAEERPEWDLLVIGDGPLRAELEGLIPAALKSRVLWTGFLDNQKTISALYRASDVLVLPSRYEPWAVVVNEAVAAGMAMVCTNVVGAAEELVRDGVNGRLFPPGDLAELTKALRDVTKNGEIDRLKAGSAGVLADWRKRADPVDGLRQALVATGVL
jgi:glycosyltransferase involved in cell wall biosynthesis